MSDFEEIKNLLKQNLELSMLIYKSTEKTRRYFLITLIATVAVIVIPLIIMAIILPSVINNFTSSYQGLL